jgi:hypothetical protein
MRSVLRTTASAAGNPGTMAAILRVNPASANASSTGPDKPPVVKLPHEASYYIVTLSLSLRWQRMRTPYYADKPISEQSLNTDFWPHFAEHTDFNIDLSFSQRPHFFLVLLQNAA